MSGLSANNMLKVGQPVILVVSEPWNLRSSSGKNLLIARIASVEDPEKEWVLCCDDPFAQGDGLDDWELIRTALIIRPRHKDMDLRRVLNGSSVTVNVLIRGGPSVPSRMVLIASIAMASFCSIKLPSTV